MPTYPHICNACQFEWEDFYGMNAKPPTKCPKCEVEGQVERLIGGASGRPIVRLTGMDLVNKIKQDAGKLAKESESNERILANLVGDNRYHQNETMRGELRKEVDRERKGFRRIQK